MKTTKDYMTSYWTKEVAKRQANGSSKWKIQQAERKLKEIKKL
jgi:hypothetical protein